MSDRFDPSEGSPGSGSRSFDRRIVVGLLALVVIVAVLLLTVFKAEDGDPDLGPVGPSSSQTRTVPTDPQTSAPVEPDPDTPPPVEPDPTPPTPEPQPDPTVPGPQTSAPVTPPTNVPQTVE